MVITIAGVLGGQDLSGFLDRMGGFTVESVIGRRMDTLRATFWDPMGQLAIGKRAEIIVYDADPATLPPGWTGFPAQAPIVDPGQPGTVTPRLFGGYVAQPHYSVVGPQRQVQVQAQDYTTRLRTTVVNRAYIPDSAHPNGWTDVQMITDLLAHCRPDFTLTQLVPPGTSVYDGGAVSGPPFYDDGVTYDGATTYPTGATYDGTATYASAAFGAVTYMPAMSFPIHTLDQFMERIVKITQCFYRVDYYKQFLYGPVGQMQAPLSISDQPQTDTFGGSENVTAQPGTPISEPGALLVPGSPNTTVTVPAQQASVIGCEQLTFAPDDSNFADKVWVIGETFTGSVQPYTLSPKPDGAGYAFPLPAPLSQPRSASVTVNGTPQGTVGLIPTDGTLDNPSGYATAVVVQTAPPLIAFRTPPPTGATVVVTGAFRYPLIQTVTDTTLQGLAGGLIFERILRNKRIDTQQLAISAGQGLLTAQGATKQGGSCVIRRRYGYDATGNIVMLQPGQTIPITHRTLFAGLLPGGGTTLNALINRLTLTLDDDSSQPYRVTVGFADRPEITDDDFIDQVVGEQGRVNAALEQPDVNQVLADLQQTLDQTGMTEQLTPTAPGTPPYVYDGATNYGYGQYG